MPEAGKNFKKAAALRDKPIYPLEEAVALLKKMAYAKFNETVEISMLGSAAGTVVWASMMLGRPPSIRAR